MANSGELRRGRECGRAREYGRGRATLIGMGLARARGRKWLGVGARSVVHRRVSRGRARGDLLLESRLEWGVDRQKLKFTTLNTTTSRG
jgi:hypothetical protein